MEKNQQNYLYMRKVQESWAREMLKSGQKVQGRNSMDGTEQALNTSPLTQ